VSLEDAGCDVVVLAQEPEEDGRAGSLLPDVNADAERIDP